MDFRDIKENLKDFSVYIIIIIAVILCVQYVVTIQQVLGPSMNPTLVEKDAVLLNKFAYRIGKIRRGDVVALNYNGEKFMVKRVIGLPGEKIEYKNNILYINDEPFEEKYLGSDVETEDFLVSGSKVYTVNYNVDTLENLESDIIPEDMYLVLGDNRQNSEDSRYYGLIKKEDIIGKTTIRIWPLSKIGLIK